jgi:Zn-dependent protease with chaperone function
MDASIWPLTLASIENFVLLNSSLSALAFGLAAGVRVMARSRSLHPLSMARIYAAALVVPLAVSAWLVIGSLLPALWLGSDAWLEEHQRPHTLHLLNALTASFDPALGYAAVLFMLFAAALMIYVAAGAYFRINRVVRCLEIGAEPAPPGRVEQVEVFCRKHGIDVGLVMSSYPFSFVWGHLRSKLVISTGLLNALTAEELSALLEHEAAHHTRRDNLLKWALTVCRYCSPVFLLTGLLYRWWGEQIEMVCDEVAARRTSAPAEVAGALVRMKRLTVSVTTRGTRLAESGFFGERGHSFERRVMRVLSLGDQTVRDEAALLSRSWVRTAALAGGAFALTLVAFFLVSPLAIHRVLEAILHIF